MLIKELKNETIHLKILKEKGMYKIFVNDTLLVNTTNSNAAYDKFNILKYNHKLTSLEDEEQKRINTMLQVTKSCQKCGSAEFEEDLINWICENCGLAV